MRDQGISVRAATSGDLDLLVPLFEGYRAFYRCAPDTAGARRFLRDRLNASDSVILIAIDDRTAAAIGFVQLYPTFSSLRMARALILNDLYVSEAHRRHGVARRLMDAARSFAEISGVVSLSLETAHDNAKARALYESLGYERDETFLSYALRTTPKLAGG